MNDVLDFYDDLPVIRQNTIDQLIAKGVPALSMGNASPAGDVLKEMRGHCHSDGYFDEAEGGELHIAILVYNQLCAPVDVACWHPRFGVVTTHCGRAFALGAEQIGNPGSFVFGQGVLVHSSVLGWLKAGRTGVYILRPKLAFDELRDLPAITAENRQHGLELKALLRPQRLPKILVRKPAQDVVYE